jgi:hypothetical protein
MFKSQMAIAMVYNAHTPPQLGLVFKNQNQRWNGDVDLW